MPMICAKKRFDASLKRILRTSPLSIPLEAPPLGVEPSLELCRKPQLHLVPLNEIHLEKIGLFTYHAADLVQEGPNLPRNGGRSGRSLPDAFGQQIRVPLEDVQVDLFLAAEVLIDRCTAEIRGLGDVVDGGGGVALVDEELLGPVQDELHAGDSFLGHSAPAHGLSFLDRVSK